MLAACGLRALARLHHTGCSNNAAAARCVPCTRECCGGNATGM